MSVGSIGPASEAGYRRERHGTHLLSQPAVIADPSTYRRAVQELEPLYWDQVGKVWVCTGYPEAAHILRDHRRFRSARLPDADALAARGWTDISRIARLMAQQMLFLDPPRHTAIRSALASAFSPRAVAARQEEVDAIVHDAISALPARGRVDLIEEFAGPLPTRLVASRLALTGHTADLLAWSEAYETLLGSLATLPGGRDRAVIPVLLDALTILREQGRQRRGGSGDDLITALANGLAGPELAGEALQEALDAVAANCIVLVAGGYQTLTQLLAMGVVLLARHPDQLELLRKEPELIGSAVDEIMRLEGSSQYIARQATEPLDLDGVTIEAGQSIVVLLAVANRDHRQFNEPDRFDIRRAEGKHLGFGIGRHHCIGNLDAEQAGRTALLGFIERYGTFQLADVADAIRWGPHANTRCPAHVLLDVAETAGPAPATPLALAPPQIRRDSGAPPIRRHEAWPTPIWPARNLRLSVDDIDTLRSRNDRPIPLDDDCLWMDAVARVAARWPQAPALQAGPRAMTYHELDRAADVLAGQLQELGVEPGSVAGVLMDRSMELYVAALAIGRAGGAFLTADTVCPPERLRSMLGEARVTVLCTQAHLAQTAQSIAPSARIVVVEAAQLAAAEPVGPIITGVRPGDTAYVVFTSGSTGVPKAISVDHEALVNLQAAQRQVFRISPGDRILQWFSPNFDGWHFDVVLALTSGARLVLAPIAGSCLGQVLLRTLTEQEVTVASLTPSAWRTLPNGSLPALRIAAAAGEVCTAGTVDRLVTPGRRVLNLYGPAEAAIWSSWHECRPGEDDPPIGVPITGKRAYVLDPDGRPVASGEVGEIWIGGVGIGRYLHQPALMRERFGPDPLGTRPNQLMYATGDLGRWRPDGRIDYVGRIDRQVKVRGERVELEEVERVLESAPGVRHASVEMREGRLAAAVVATESGAFDEATVRAYLRSRLHGAMVPASFRVVGELTLSVTGKLSLAGAARAEPVAGGATAPAESATSQVPDLLSASAAVASGAAADHAAKAGQVRFAVPVPRDGRSDQPPDPRSEARLVWELARLFASCLQLPHARIQANSDFLDLGGDSLSLEVLLTAVEDNLGVILDVEAVIANPTPNGIAGLIQASGGNGR